MEAVANTDNIIEDVLKGAVSSLFTTMVGTECDYKRTRDSAEFFLTVDVAGIMHLTGAQSGMVACGASEDLARDIIGRMTGVAENELTEIEISDGLAEMVNILCGFIKTQCPEMEISLTPPLSVAGKECSIRCKVHRPVTIVDFDVDGKEFTVMAGL